MNDYHTKTINIFCYIFAALIHILLGFIHFSPSSNSRDSKIAINLKNKKLMDIRDLGKKDSKIDKATFSPKEQSEADFLKKFAISKDVHSASQKDLVEKNLKNKSKKEIEDKIIHKEGRNPKEVPQQKAMSYTSRQAVAQVRQERSIDNPVLNQLNYNLQFLPPKGIPHDELNDFEKVFYAFYKRVATQYINSIQSTYLSLANDKPYMEARFRNHKPIVLSGFIQYDKDGNAEVIKILKSSEDNEVHQMFEDSLKKMNKIPNIAKELIDENGKYQAFFQLSINERAQY